MKVAFIGSGNLATHLSQALQASGTDVCQVYSPTLSHAQHLADKLNCQAVSSINDICYDADAYIISIKDDALAEVAATLRKGREDSIIIHTAGSVPLSVLDAGASATSPTPHTTHCAVLYPMQTFSKARSVNFHEIPCFIEASDDMAMDVVSSLANSISDTVVPLSSEKRKKLHLSAVFACNFVNHCYHLAERTLKDADLDFKLLLPLINETARKVSEMSPHDAQTGPMVRNDVTVMNRQLGLITDDITKDIYRLMAKSIYQMNDEK